MNVRAVAVAQLAAIDAGAIQNEDGRNGGGSVATLGVTREWRGTGIARTLLLRTFAEFYARGVPRVTVVHEKALA